MSEMAPLGQRTVRGSLNEMVHDADDVSPDEEEDEEEEDEEEEDEEDTSEDERDFE